MFVDSIESLKRGFLLDNAAMHILRKKLGEAAPNDLKKARSKAKQWNHHGTKWSYLWQAINFEDSGRTKTKYIFISTRRNSHKDLGPSLKNGGGCSLIRQDYHMDTGSRKKLAKLIIHGDCTPLVKLRWNRRLQMRMRSWYFLMALNMKEQPKVSNDTKITLFQIN